MFVFVLLCITFCNCLEEEEKAGCFAIVSYRCIVTIKCSVALSHSAVGWFEVCDCGVSWSYSLTFLLTHSHFCVYQRLVLLLLAGTTTPNTSDIVKLRSKLVAFLNKMACTCVVA